MQGNPVVSHVKSFWKTAREHCLLAAVPLLLFPALAAGYAFLRQPQWRASQALLVRDEVVGAQGGVGRFESVDAMKTAQETILEIARNRNVVSAALKRVGAPAELLSQPAVALWPSDLDVEQALDEISVSAPKGAEFGRTEVIYLTVTSTDRDRSVKLASAMCDELEQRLKAVRNEKASSVIVELNKTHAIAGETLEASTRKLEAMEREVGGDLGELRIMNEQGAGDSNLRVASNQIKNEIRTATAALESQQQQIDFLVAALEDPNRLVATPNRLLLSQPGLKRLKDGLVDAQLRTAELSGTRSLDHPLVKAALVAEDEVQQDLHNELTTAIRGARGDLAVTNKRLESLRQQLLDVDQRLTRLAGLRARYGNLVADVRHKTTIVERAAKNLADARASQEASRSSLLTRLDSPDSGNKPIGPGKTTILLAGGAAGLAASVGLILLITPIGGDGGRRWSDQLFGRRQNDRSTPDDARPARRENNARGGNQVAAPTSRRSTDQVAVVAAPPAETQPAKPTAGVGDVTAEEGSQDDRERRSDSDRRLAERRGPVS